MMGSTKKNLNEQFVLTKKNVMIIVSILVMALVMPSAIYGIEFRQYRDKQEEIIESLKVKLSTEIKSYVKEDKLSDYVLSDEDGVSSGEVIKPGSEDSVVSAKMVKDEDAQAIADAVAELLNDEYLSRIEGDVLDRLYANVETIVAEKLADATPVTEETKQETQAPTTTIIEKSYTQEDIKKISEAVSAILTKDIESYKKTQLVEYSSTDNLYTSVNDALGLSNRTISSLSSDVSTLQSTYDSRFGSLEETDASLQSQINQIKSQNAITNNQYNTLLTSITLANGNIDTLKKELAVRIDKLSTDSQKTDAQVANLLIEAQKQLSSVDAANDAKIYDNTVRIIELTDKLTNMNTGFSEAIQVLEVQSGEDTTELYNKLSLLEYELSAGDTALSTTLEKERTERLSDIKEILALIDSANKSTDETSEKTYLEIERLSKQLAVALANTDTGIRDEYTRLIDDTNTQLAQATKELKEQMAAQEAKLSKKIDDSKDEVTQLLDESNENLSKEIADSNSAINKTIDSKNKELNYSIAKTKDELQGNIDTTKNELNKSIDSTNKTLDSTKSELQKSIDDKGTELQGSIKATKDELNESIDSTNKTLDSTKSELQKSIDDKESALQQSINDSNSALQKSIDDKDTELKQSIESTSATLSGIIDENQVANQNSINATNEALTKYIESTNVGTKEELLTIIKTLQQEVGDLQAQIDALKNEKLDKQQSTRYDYTEDANGNTIRVFVPDTNPNLTKRP